MRKVTYNELPDASEFRKGVLSEENRIKITPIKKVNGKAASEDKSKEAFQPVDPCEYPVSGSQVAQKVKDKLNQYLVLPEHGDMAITLWIMFSYVYNRFDVCPILSITSPEKRCGKTSTLALIEAHCQKVLSGSNITPAATFRAIEKWNPTLVVDEADTFLNQKEELRGILNSGHIRTAAFVTRAVAQGKKYDVKRFSTWTPKVIALIGKLTDTLEDRSIRIKMRRKKKNEFRERIPYSKLDDNLKEIRQEIARWATDFEPNYNFDVPKKLDDRAADNWLPLLSIARNIGWTDTATEAAESLSGTPDTQTYQTLLLEDIYEIFSGEWREKDSASDAIFTVDLLEKLNGKPEKPWSEFSHGKPMTAHKLAYMLRPFEISSHNISIGDKRLKGFTKKNFEDAFERYL